MTIPLFDKLVSAFGGSYADAQFIEYDNTSTSASSLPNTVQGAITDLQTQLTNLSAQGVLTGRNFERVNTDLNINQSNANQYADRILLYAAGIDKRVTWQLPTTAEIQAAGESFPYVIEFIHLGGTARLPSSGQNRVDLDVKPDDTARIRTSTGLVNLPGIDLLREDRVIMVKETASGDWFADRLSHDSSTFILPSGVAELRDQEVSDIDNIATQLGSISINKGDMFLVTDQNGGNRFGRDINDGDILMALVDNPTFVTNSEDWTVFDSSQSVLPNSLMLFARTITNTGARIDLSRDVFVNESNVIAFSSTATGAGLNQPFTYSNANGNGGQHQAFFINNAIQLSDLQGGTLTLAIAFNASSFSGFLPDLIDLTLEFGTTTFTFPLTGIDPSGGMTTVDIQIPNADYSEILNTNCNVTLTYTYRGASFIGSFTILGLVNTLNGTLRQSITDIASAVAQQLEQRINMSIARLGDNIDENDSELSEIQPRISPYRNVQSQTPTTHARFLDSSGSDAFPSDIGAMTPVSNDNPRFTVTGTAVFVAVIADGSAYGLNDDSGNVVTPLDDSLANVDLGASRTFENQVWFLYRVNGLTAGAVIEAETFSIERVLAWPTDIAALQDSIESILTQLTHAALDLPDALIDVLDNNVTVTEQTTPSVNPTTYNTGLGSSNTQKIFYETNPVAPTGTKSSEPISNTRNKLLYIDNEHQYGNGELVTAFNGVSTNTPLVTFLNGDINANVFVPAIPAGSRTDTIYPSPANKVSGADIWQTIPALVIRNGIPVAEADELFFTRNVPSTATTLTIAYRGHANGNLFGAGTGTLANVGGANEIATTFTISDGSETATIEIRYYPNFQGSGRAIRVSITERVNTGLPTINDIQVILSYDRTVTVPATPATVRSVTIERQAVQGQYNVIGFKPSATNTLIIVGNLREVDTGYTFTDLFGSTEKGAIVALTTNAEFLNYANITLVDTLITDLENHATLPQYGLFSTTYTHETIVNLGTQLIVKDDQGNDRNVGNLLRQLLNA